MGCGIRRARTTRRSQGVDESVRSASMREARARTTRRLQRVDEERSARADDGRGVATSAIKRAIVRNI